MAVLCWACAAAGAQTALPADFAQSLARAGVPRDAVSVLVTALPADAVETRPGPAQPRAQPAPRLTHRADAAMHPASVMKLVTTYAGLDLLGPDFTWTNRVYTDGAVADGVLNGNLVLRGSGDPKLVLERLWLLLQQVRQAGIDSIEGDLVLDNSAFELPPHDAARFDGAPLRAYNAAPDALLVNFKTLQLTFAPDAAARVARPTAGMCTRRSG